MTDIAGWDWHPNGETIVSEWLPIETAPKDGQHVLLLATITMDAGGRCWWLHLGQWLSGYGEAMDTRCWEDAYGPSHPDLPKHVRRPDDLKVLYWSKIMQLPRAPRG